MSGGRKISGNTADMIRGLAERCLQRGEAMKKRARFQGPMGEEMLTAQLNGMALDYFVGAMALSDVLGVPELVSHLNHVVLTQIDIRGYAAVEQLAMKRSPILN